MTLSHLVWGIPNVPMHYLPDKKPRRYHVLGYTPDGLSGIVVKHNIDINTKVRGSFLIRTVRVRLPRYNTLINTSGLIQRFFLDLLHCSQIDTVGFFYWILRPESQAVKHAISVFLVKADDDFLKDSDQLTLVCCTVDEYWNQQRVFAKLWL